MAPGDVHLHTMQSAIASANHSDKLNSISQASNVPMSFDRAIATTAALDVNSEDANVGDHAQFHDLISQDAASMLYTDHNFYSDFWPSHGQDDGAAVINTKHNGTMSYVNDNDDDQRSRYINSCYGPHGNPIVADNNNTNKEGETNGMKNVSITPHTTSCINLSTTTYTSSCRPPSSSSLIKLSDMTIREGEAAEIKERMKEGNQYMADLKRKPINGRREENGSEQSITNMQRIWMENYEQVSDPQLGFNADIDLLEKDRQSLSRPTTINCPNAMATYNQLLAEDDDVVAGHLWRAPGHADRSGGSNLDDIGVSRMQEGSPVNHRVLRANARSYTYLMEEPDRRSPRENTICTYLDQERGPYHQSLEVQGMNTESKMDPVDENAYEYMSLTERQPASSSAEVLAALTQITENLDMAAAAAAMSNALVHEEEEITAQNFDIDEDLEIALFGSCRDGGSGGAAAAAYLSCDEFRMYEFKIRGCMREKSHDWTQCPFAHPGEKARRRDPRLHTYAATPCPDFRKSSCKRGDDCELSHGVFECWLHPSRYRTQLCKDGTQCKRKVCFFAHSPSQLRMFCCNTGTTTSASSSSSSSLLCSSTSSSSSSFSVHQQQQMPVSQNIIHDPRKIQQDIPSFCSNQYGKNILREDDLHRVAHQQLGRSSDLLYDGSPVRIAMDSSEFIEGLPNYYHNMFLTKYHDPSLSLATATTRQLQQYLQQYRQNSATSTQSNSCMIPAVSGCGGEKNHIAVASRQLASRYKFLDRDQMPDYPRDPFGLMPYTPPPQYVHGQELRPPVLCPHELISPDQSFKLYNVSARNLSRTHTPIPSYSRSPSNIADIHHSSFRNAILASSHGVIRPGASSHCHMNPLERSSSGHGAFTNSTANMCSQSMNPAYSHEIRQLYRPYTNQYGLSTDSTLITPQQMDMLQLRRHEMSIPVDNSSMLVASDIGHGSVTSNMKRPYLPDTSRNTADGLTVIPGSAAANTSDIQCHANNIRHFSSAKDDRDRYVHHPLVNPPVMNSCSHDKSSQYIASSFRSCSGDDNNSASPPSHHHQHAHQSLEYNTAAARHSLVQIPVSHQINFSMDVSHEGQNSACQQRNYHMINTAKTARAFDHPQYLQQQAPAAMEAETSNRDETAVRQVGDEKQYNSGSCGDNNSQLLSHLEASLHEMEIRTMDYLQQKRKLITASGLQVQSDIPDPWRSSELNLSYSPWNTLNHISTARSELPQLAAPGSIGQIMSHHHGADEICNKMVGAGGSDHQILSQDQKHHSIMNNTIISHDWVNELVK